MPNLWGSHMPALAFLLLDGPAPELTQDALLTQLGADWPDLGACAYEDEKDADDGDGGIVLDVDGSLVAVMTSPGQIGDDLAEIAAHSRLWPKAQEVPVGYDHRAVVTVFTPDASGHEGAIADATLLSQVLASAVAVSASVRAVYLGGAGHVVLPELLRELAQSVLPEPLLPVWVALNVGSRPDGVLTGHTRGLESLEMMNVEIPESPEDAATTLDRLAGIAAYLLEHGPVIGDGDTIGSTAVAEIVARHRPSQVAEDETVLRLEFGATARKGFFSKFRR